MSERKVQVFEDRDLGLEWDEDNLLGQNGYEVLVEQRVPVSEIYAGFGACSARKAWARFVIDRATVVVLDTTRQARLAVGDGFRHRAAFEW